MNNKLLSLSSHISISSDVFFNLLTNIRESFFKEIISEKSSTHDFTHDLNNDTYLHLYYHERFNYRDKCRINVLKKTKLYQELSNRHTPGIILAITHTILRIEDIINSKIYYIVPEKKNYINITKNKINFDSASILLFTKHILEKTINNSLYSPQKPICIFDLELKQLSVRINNTKKNVQIFPKHLSPEVCSYIVINCYIKYFLDIDRDNYYNEILKGYADF